MYRKLFYNLLGLKINKIKGRAFQCVMFWNERD